MKSIITTSFLLLSFIHSYSQNEVVEREIRQIEKKRIDAFMTKDTSALLKIWAADYTVNRPAGMVSTRDKVLEMVLTDTISFSRFENEIENILIKKDFVAVMGNETAVPKGNNPDAGKTLKRRFTHIWTKQSGSWRLVVRHANVLCK